MLYAIGEIALVVIGILIALQINNWNEWRKDRIKEEKMLEQLARAIQTNANKLVSTIETIKVHKEKTGEVISIIEEKRPYNTSMNDLFHYPKRETRLILNKSSYEQLKTTGFDIVQSDSLRETIMNLFEYQYSDTEVIVNEIELWGLQYFGKFNLDNFLVIEGEVDPFAAVYDRKAQSLTSFRTGKSKES